MKILNKLAIATVLSLPIIGAGCTNQTPKQKGEVYLELKDLQHKIPHLADINLYDENKDDIISTDEALKFIKQQILSLGSNKSLSQEDKTKIITIIEKVTQHRNESKAQWQNANPHLEITTWHYDTLISSFKEALDLLIKEDMKVKN